MVNRRNIVVQDLKRVYCPALLEHARERRVHAEELARGEVHARRAVVDERDVAGDRGEADADVVRRFVVLELVAVWSLDARRGRKWPGVLVSLRSVRKGDRNGTGGARGRRRY